jgi:hypothetical protein
MSTKYWEKDFKNKTVKVFLEELASTNYKIPQVWKQLFWQKKGNGDCLSKSLLKNVSFNIPGKVKILIISNL